MNAGAVGVLLLGSGLLACGRQELWKSGATGGVGGGVAGATSSVAVADAGADGAAGFGIDAAAPVDAASVPADPFIASLPGLVLWVDAARDVTLTSSGEVFRWKDQSPASNDLRPSTFPSRYATDGPGGHSVVRLFAMSQLGTPGDGTVSLGFGTGDFLVEVVWAWNTQMSVTPALFGMWPLQEASHDTAGLISLGLQADGTPSLSVLAVNGLLEATSTTQVTDVAFHLSGVRRVVAAGAETVDLRIDGRADPSLPGVPLANLGVSAWAALGGGTSVAEVVVIKGPTSDEALATLESHLKEKYGI
jgi:hypothetical protein